MPIDEPDKVTPRINRMNKTAYGAIAVIHTA
jgi:hypothetical protein